jgi:hypothetical protein
MTTLPTKPLTLPQAAALTGMPCESCGADLNKARRLDTWRRGGWTLLFLVCGCGKRHGVKFKYQTARGAPEVG